MEITPWTGEQSYNKVSKHTKTQLTLKLNPYLGSFYT